MARSSGLHWLDVEVSPESQGLRLVKIGDQSPFRRLATLDDSMLQASLEIGDRIVAINGVFACMASDLEALGELECSEVTVFDYRTRQTVSWLISLPGPHGR
jgi:hypothetical protein